VRANSPRSMRSHVHHLHDCEAQLRSKDRLFLKLVVTNAIVAGNHDPALRSRLTEPDYVLRSLRKQRRQHSATGFIAKISRGPEVTIIEKGRR
jgi:hypothetical protein